MSKLAGKRVLRAILRKISVPLRRCLRRRKATASPEPTVDLAPADEVFTQGETVATQNDNVSTETQAPQPPEHMFEVHRVALGSVKKHEVTVDDNLNGPGPSIREDSPLRQQHATVKQRQKHIRFDLRRKPIIVFQCQEAIVEELNRQVRVQAPAVSQHVPIGRSVEGCNPSFSGVDAQQRMLFLMYGVQPRQDDTYQAYFDRQFDMIFGTQTVQEDMNRPYRDTGRQWPSFDGRTRRCRLWDDLTPVHIEFNQVVNPKAPKKPIRGLSTARQLDLSSIFDQAIERKSLVEQVSMHLACICQVQRQPNAHRAYRYGLDDAACRLPFIVMEYYFSGFTYTGSLELVLGICPIISSPKKRKLGQDPQSREDAEQSKYLIPIAPDGPYPKASPNKVWLERWRQFTQACWIDASRVYYVPADLFHESKSSGLRLSKESWESVRQGRPMDSLADEEAQFEKAFNLYQAEHSIRGEHAIVRPAVCRLQPANQVAATKENQEGIQ
ncbi:uncharacterized protein Z519_01214 [Cladophialophora bantiana CBS 173.52]|uniref:Uncharacterized protein n=1 Tax=Cladophialophora bantiana (strain ATCC 10958 / CBS 173.52 / CDC B-1940 / NIH 8579) TaxID=1442370 RepID=A0A0D2I366_CLAB1|nr:uncharacterized protein Z519_01214 [Cladophialophora bantiana CBS 173.52]KIW97630.1 hypothetical protein Z519_01214 [Cladophialophora bantiana CBS 173.52]